MRFGLPDATLTPTLSRERERGREPVGAVRPLSRVRERVGVRVVG